MKVKADTLQKRIAELERKIKELESRPSVFFPYYPQPMYPYPYPYPNPNPNWWPLTTPISYPWERGQTTDWPSLHTPTFY